MLCRQAALPEWQVSGMATAFACFGWATEWAGWCIHIVRDWQRPADSLLSLAPSGASPPPSTEPSMNMSMSVVARELSSSSPPRHSKLHPTAAPAAAQSQMSHPSAKAGVRGARDTPESSIRGGGALAAGRAKGANKIDRQMRGSSGGGMTGGFGGKSLAELRGIMASQADNLEAALSAVDSHGEGILSTAQLSEALLGVSWCGLLGIVQVLRCVVVACWVLL